MQRDSVPSWKKLTSIWKKIGGKFVIRKETRSLPPLLISQAVVQSRHEIVL